MSGISSKSQFPPPYPGSSLNKEKKYKQKKFFAVAGKADCQLSKKILKKTRSLLDKENERVYINKKLGKDE